MKNLSFLKGLAVGLGIATIGGVVYANSISSDDSGENAWVVVGDNVYACTLVASQAIADNLNVPLGPACLKAHKRSLEKT